MKRIGINACILNGGKRSESLTGIGYYVYQIVKNLINHDDDNYYLLFSFAPLMVDFEPKDNYEIVIIPSPTERKLLWSAFTLSAVLKKYHLDAFWSPSYTLPILKDKGTSYIVTVHDLANFMFKGISREGHLMLAIEKYFFKKSCKKADRIISVSEATKRDVMEMFNISSEKIDVIYQGGNWDDCDRGQHTKGLSPYVQPYFLYVGTLQPRKNIDSIISAFARLKEQYKCDAKLVFAGGIGWGMDETLEKAKQCACKEDIIFEGRVSEERKETLYKNALALVFPSLYEGFGVPILEAFHFETLVITARNSALTEAGGEAALYIDDAKDTEALSEVMHKVITMDNTTRDTFLAKGRQHVEKFSWYNCAMRIKEVLVE